MSTPLDELRAEQERLRDEVELLRTQVEAILSWLQERDVSRPARQGTANARQVRTSAEQLYEMLSPTFTVEDLIQISEDADLNVFTAYQELNSLIVAGWVVEKSGVFKKVRSRNTPSD